MLQNNTIYFIAIITTLTTNADLTIEHRTKYYFEIEALN